MPFRGFTFARITSGMLLLLAALVLTVTFTRSAAEAGLGSFGPVAVERVTAPRD